MNLINNITHEEVTKYLTTSAFGLLASQSSISFPIIKRIHRRLQQGHKFGSIKVLDDIIIDGHHSYICLNILGMKVESVKAGKNTFKIETIKWLDINVDIKDYDTILEAKNYSEKYD